MWFFSGAPLRFLPLPFDLHVLGAPPIWCTRWNTGEWADGKRYCDKAQTGKSDGLADDCTVLQKESQSKKRALSRLRRTWRLCKTTQRQMPVYGDENLLFKLQGALGLGCVGIVLPILPTVPFFLLTVFCFSQSSQKLHDWFVNTKMYKKHLESFVQKKGMTVRTKATIMTSVTLLMGFGFTMMMLKAIYIPCIILAVVWVCHIIYFIFGVKTI